MGATHFSGPVYSDNGFVGATSGGAISATNITASGTLAVTGGSTLTGNTTVGGTLGVTGAMTMSAAATVGTTLGVTGMTTLTGGMTLGAAVFNIVSATSIRVPAGTAASVPANFSADRYITVTDGSTTRYIPLANAVW